ncbi:succinate dehydrogenase assembly factor 2 [Marinibacterium sp. SX1]|uniref:succinate dehydrogenase assembly factor 2 n=1 Tax=Marinibacterium sp. SX1 TaxID=3388424 RepID=UPI003D1676F4
MTEPREIRVKRLKMRSMRRGIREMDLILTAYADSHLDAMSEGELDLFDQLLGENDQDLYAWVTGQRPAEGHLAALIEDIAGTYQK